MKAKNEALYIEKLKNPKWQKMRLKVLERDEWKCQRCFEDDECLHVHHRYYEKNKDPWDYPIEALITLCEICLHGEKERVDEALSDLNHFLKQKFLGNDIDSIKIGFGLLNQYDPKWMEIISEAIEWVLTDT